MSKPHSIDARRTTPNVKNASSGTWLAQNERRAPAGSSRQTTGERVPMDMAGGYQARAVPKRVFATRAVRGVAATLRVVPGGTAWHPGRKRELNSEGQLGRLWQVDGLSGEVLGLANLGGGVAIDDPLPTA